MWANWVHPHEPAYVMWVDLRVRGSLRRSWPSGLAAWPAPLASLLAVDGRIDCQGRGKLKSLSALIICVGLGALTKQATQIHMMPPPE